MFKGRTMNIATDFYKKLGQAINMIMKEDGKFEFLFNDKLVPILIEGKHLTNPITTFLRNPNPNELIAFHPLCESVSTTESPVLHKLRQLMQYRLQSVISILAEELIILSLATDKHEALSTKQMEPLILLGDVKKGILPKIRNVIKESSNATEGLSLYVKRGGKIGKREFSRICAARVGFLSNVNAETQHIAGIKCTKNEYKQILALYQYILPDINDGGFNVGSNSQSAPSFSALLECFIKIAKQLNKITKRYRSCIKDAEEIDIYLGFADDMDDMARMAALIPSLQGNTGEPINPVKESPVEEAISRTPQAIPDCLNDTAPASTQPVQAPEPVSSVLGTLPSIPSPTELDTSLTGSDDNPFMRFSKECNKNQFLQNQQQYNGGWGNQPQQPQRGSINQVAQNQYNCNQNNQNWGNNNGGWNNQQNNWNNNNNQQSGPWGYLN